MHSGKHHIHENDIEHTNWKIYSSLAISIRKLQRCVAYNLPRPILSSFQIRPSAAESTLTTRCSRIEVGIHNLKEETEAPATVCTTSIIPLLLLPSDLSQCHVAF